MAQWMLPLRIMPLNATLKKDYPEVTNYCRFFGGNGQPQIEIDKVIYKETNLWVTDSTLFDVFTYDILSGDSKTALTAPNSLVLTRRLAEKFYGKIDVVGEQMKVNNSFATVTAVIENPQKIQKSL